METCKRSAPTGFIIKSCAPARIDAGIDSIAVNVVCMITGVRVDLLRNCLKTSIPSISGRAMFKISKDMGGTSMRENRARVFSPVDVISVSKPKRRTIASSVRPCDGSSSAMRIIGRISIQVIKAE